MTTTTTTTTTTQRASARQPVVSIETDFNNAAIRSNPQMKQTLGSLTALGRVGNADDIGGVVAFLCSDEARWVNGQRIEASGGINI
jgi:NAD(P)-dependent dehydrogenase (short-subunit alcohol dehydrogenase family)